MNICIRLLQNPHPVLALIYYSSKFLSFIEKLCRVKMRWPLCWGEWKHSNGKWERVQHPPSFHHFPTFFQQPWTNISGPTDAHRHLDEALMLLLCSRKRGLGHSSRIKGLHAWCDFFFFFQCPFLTFLSIVRISLEVVWAWVTITQDRNINTFFDVINDAYILNMGRVAAASYPQGQLSCHFWALILLIRDEDIWFHKAAVAQGWQLLCIMFIYITIMQL